MKITKTEQKLLRLLVERLHGHSCCLFPRDSKPDDMPKGVAGFSVGTGRHVTLEEIVTLCRNPDDTEVET